MLNLTKSFIVGLLILAASNAAAQSLTGPQKNARDTALDYLSMGGFSKHDLLNQLQFGSLFKRADAEAALATLVVDWNEQAVQSANLYMALMSFSCDGLIRQLSGKAAGGFTVEQATHGANQTDACK